jgi:hypothetical protein
VAWHLNPALTNFRNAVNEAYPNRDRTSDGTIGDAAHQVSTSDHNEDADGSVDAWDMDVEVNGPGQPYKTDVERLKETFELHESSRYWIHNREIASRSTGWKRQPYTGSNPHDKHVHWNTRESHEDSTAPWPIGAAVTDVALTDAQNGALRVSWQNAYCMATGSMMIPGKAEEGGGKPHWAVAHLSRLTMQVEGLTAAVGKLAEAVANGTGVTPEALQAAVTTAVEAAAGRIADAVATEQAQRLQE